MALTMDVDYIDKLNNEKYKLYVLCLAMSGTDEMTEECRNGIGLILWELIESIKEIVNKDNQRASPNSN